MDLVASPTDFSAIRTLIVSEGHAEKSVKFRIHSGSNRTLDDGLTNLILDV